MAQPHFLLQSQPDPIQSSKPKPPYRFGCDYCEKKFQDTWKLQRHRRIHTGEKPFKCDVCDYRSARKDKLALHMMNHTGEKPHKCDVCAYASTRKDKLNMHMRCHTGEKPYKCNYCSFQSARKDKLTIHLNMHQNNSSKSSAAAEVSLYKVDEVKVENMSLLQPSHQLLQLQQPSDIVIDVGKSLMFQ